jgi:hypothetical protein
MSASDVEDQRGPPEPLITEEHLREDAPPVEATQQEQMFPEGIDLQPAFDAIIERIADVRGELLRMLSSGSDRGFARQRELLCKYQSFVRAYDVMAGHCTPDGVVLDPLPVQDAKHAEHLADIIDETVQHTAGRMRGVASLFKSMPVEHTRPARQPPPRPEQYAQPHHREGVNHGPSGQGPAPSWMRRVASSLA